MEAIQVNVTEGSAVVGTTNLSGDISEFSVEIIVPNAPIQVSIDYLGQTRSLIVISVDDNPNVSVRSEDSGLRDNPPYAEFIAEFSQPVVPFIKCNAGQCGMTTKLDEDLQNTMMEWKGESYSYALLLLALNLH